MWMKFWQLQRTEKVDGKNAVSFRFPPQAAILLPFPPSEKISVKIFRQGQTCDGGKSARRILLIFLGRSRTKMDFLTACIKKNPATGKTGTGFFIWSKKIQVGQLANIFRLLSA
ncbi:hypothetical protein [Angelakisella massiliensis]|uniref:hypothetical protein n=1 Tax=Angelakisella massiliensis TaxID=1871018 RepID=UPI0008F85551|nr:hypothetical protein [Angelakisella massiliensis]